MSMQAVVETPAYLKDAEAIFTRAEREQIVSTIAADPNCGDVMQGTRGVRKVRVGRGGKGKSGVGRVVYVFRDDVHPIYLLTALQRMKRAI